MLLNDYLSKTTHGRRILIVSDLVRGQALIRKHEKKTGGMVKNVSCMTIMQMSDLLYTYFLSENGYEDEIELLDSDEAMMAFRSVLLDNIGRLKYFNNERVMNIATISEIFGKVTLIMANGWNGEESRSANDRIDDLKLLIAEYEKKLESEKLMDRVTKERFVLEKLNASPAAADEISAVFGAEISYLEEDIKTLNGIEQELLSFLTDEKKSVAVFDGRITMESLDNCKGKVSFYKGYGSFNEASYIANDIFEKEYHYGDVTVMYSNAGQLVPLSAALSGNGIPMRIVSDHPDQDDPFIVLTKSIIDWAECDYSERALEKILSSQVISIKIKVAVKDNTGDADGKADKDKIEEKNILAGQEYFCHVLNARERYNDGYILGWGFERNKCFIEHEEKIVTDEASKAFLEMHKELLTIFSDGHKPYNTVNKVSPVDIYTKLVKFVKKYTIGGETANIAIASLEKLTGAVGFEKRKLTLDEALNVIKEVMSGLSVSDKESAGAVKVQSFNKWSIPDRKHVYIVGLSLKDMSHSNTESPVIFDDEMEMFLAKGYVPTIKNESEHRENDIMHTLALFDGESLVLGYSDYDTSGFCENNASAFYRKVFSVFGCGEVKNIPEFVYGNPTDEQLITDPADYKQKDNTGIIYKTSSSILEVLLDCPKKYAYSKILSVPENDFKDCNHKEWLDAMHRGSFFHEIAASYINSKLILKRTEQYDTAVTESCIKEIAQEIKKQFLIKIPCTYAGLADSETENIAEKAIEFFRILLDRLVSEKDWRILAAEQKFVEATYSVNGLNGAKHDFTINGFVDRIDYRVDKSAKKCFIRIADYKTGSKEKKEKEKKLGKLLQYAIYKKAIIDTGKVEDDKKEKIPVKEHLLGKIAFLEDDPSIKDYDFCFEEFRYEFPMGKDPGETIIIGEKELEVTNLDRLRLIIDIVENDHIFPDHKELSDKLSELLEAYKKKIEENSETDPDQAKKYQYEVKPFKELQNVISENDSTEKGNCQYCAYVDLCLNRKAGEL